MPKQLKKKLTFKNDEFDDFRSANEDSDDCNYKPTGTPQKGGAKRGRKKIDKKVEQKKVAEAMEQIEAE